MVMNPTADRKQSLFTSFFLHLHPRSLPEETLRFHLSFGLGGMAFMLVIVLLLTGLLQILAYSADTLSAYRSIQNMYAPGNAAGFVRNLHHWSGNLLVIVAGLHLLRVFLTGAIGAGRRINWILGILLFLIILLANFTGYLLPWDQLAYWAVTIFTNMALYIPFIGTNLVELLRGGLEVGPPTLANFFAIHAAILPALLVVLLVFHFWLIRRAGGLVVREKDTTQERKRVQTVPWLIQREAAVGLTLLACLFVFSAMFDAPLGQHANPSESPNPAKAAWYFMGLQELLLHMHPTFAFFYVPLLSILGLIAIPFINDATLAPGCWCSSRRGITLALSSLGAGFLGSLLVVAVDDVLVKSATSAVEYNWLSRGLVPLAITSLLFFLGYLALVKKAGFSRSEAIMGVVMTVSGIVVGLTLVGIWFRGPGMSLVFF